ncbi:protein of unknown function [Cupriavidus taiwanensis]|nr:protein of unknown function [Cupriavidus taiwanensis]
MAEVASFGQVKACRPEVNRVSADTIDGY